MKCSVGIVINKLREYETQNRKLEILHCGDNWRRKRYNETSSMDRDRKDRNEEQYAVAAVEERQLSRRARPGVSARSRRRTIDRIRITLVFESLVCSVAVGLMGVGVVHETVGVLNEIFVRAISLGLSDFRLNRR